MIKDPVVAGENSALPKNYKQDDYKFNTEEQSIKHATIIT